MRTGRDQDYTDTGYAPIDEEHRNISQLLQGVVVAVNDGSADDVAYVLDAVLDTVTAHFRHEERLMERTAFTDRARHKAAHDGFLTDTQRHRGVLATHGVTPEFRRWALGRMRGWFGFHVMAYDVELGQFLAERGSAVTSEVERLTVP